MTHRTSQKEILKSQLKLLKILLTIVRNIPGPQVGLKGAYMKQYDEFEASREEMMANRIRFRKYLGELNYFGKAPF